MKNSTPQSNTTEYTLSSEGRVRFKDIAVAREVVSKAVSLAMGEEPDDCQAFLGRYGGDFSFEGNEHVYRTDFGFEGIARDFSINSGIDELVASDGFAVLAVSVGNFKVLVSAEYGEYSDEEFDGFARSEFIVLEESNKDALNKFIRLETFRDARLQLLNLSSKLQNLHLRTDGKDKCPVLEGVAAAISGVEHELELLGATSTGLVEGAH